MDDITWTWREVFDTSPVAMSIIDVHGRQIAGNPAYASLLGFPEADMDHIDVGRITRPEDQEWTAAYLTRLINGDLDVFETDKIYVRADGSTLRARLRATALRGSDGRCKALLGIVEPVEAPIPTSDAVLRRLVELSNDALTVVGADGRVLESNGRYRSVEGYPPEFWAGRSLFDIIDSADMEEAIAFQGDLLAAPSVEQRTEISVIAADGTRQRLAVRAVNLLEDESVRGVVMITRNVTEERRLVEELARRTEIAEAEAAARASLLATVSHELRNPLHAVLGLAELLASADLLGSAGEQARTLHLQLRALTSVTQDLLDGATIESGAMVIQREPTDVRDLAAGVAELGRMAAMNRSDLTITSEVAGDVPDRLLLDGERLRQVLANLIGNAVKFTPSGEIGLLVSRGGDVLHCAVRDNGVGIPAEELDSVLEPFTTGSTAGSGRGAGLGLSIVRRLTEAMGGRLRVVSSVAAGSTFTVELPLEIAHVEAPTPAPKLLTDPAGMCVLVVEDNLVNRMLAVSQLERLGMRPIVAASGEEAITLMTEVGAPAVDVVLMDHQLPGINGVETTLRLRSALGSGMPPVVGLTASASSAQREAFLAAGMDDFVAKPATLQDLDDAIRRAAASRSEQSTNGTTKPTPATGAERKEPDRATEVDVEVLDRLTEELGDVDIVRSLVATFLDELPERRRALESGLEAGDEAATRRAAHVLRSSAGLLGALRLAEWCRAVERDSLGTTERLTSLSEATAAQLADWMRTTSTSGRK